MTHNSKRRANAKFYDENLKGVVTPYVPEGYKHVYHQYTIRVPGGKRDALREYLKEREIGTEVYYPVPDSPAEFLHGALWQRANPACHRSSRQRGAFNPGAPSVEQEDLETVACSINEFMAGK